jgi:hypothetical protein
MYSIVLNRIKQHEIIDGDNNYGKNDKSGHEIHKDIVLSTQKEVNFKVKCWDDKHC